MILKAFKECNQTQHWTNKCFEIIVKSMLNEFNNANVFLQQICKA